MSEVREFVAVHMYGSFIQILYMHSKANSDANSEAADWQQDSTGLIEIKVYRLLNGIFKPDDPSGPGCWRAILKNNSLSHYNEEASFPTY